MTRQDAIAIACKVMGLVIVALLIVQLIVLLPMLLSFMRSRDGIVRSLAIIGLCVVAIGVVCAVGVILLVKSDAISRKVCGKSAEMPLEINLTRDELLRVSVIVLGIYFAATAFPRILVEAVRLIRSATTAGDRTLEWGLELFGQRVAQFIIGVLFIIIARPRGALDLMRKLRTAGRPTDDSPEDDHTQEK